MNVITRRRIMEFMARHPDAAPSLDRWYRLARRAKWSSLQDVRATFPQADPVRVASGNTVTVFSIAGNAVRLVSAIHYDAQRVYVLRIMTHVEYSKGFWRDSL
jgi:mRNA interferase HigB